MVLHFSNVETVEVTSKVGGPEMVAIVPSFPLSDSQTVFLAIIHLFYFNFFLFLFGGGGV